MHACKEERPQAVEGSRTQADRRARSRYALLEAAARGLSTYGYGDLVLARVASEAGYTRGAIYHQFADKEALALEVVRWVETTWREEVGRLADEQESPVDALLALARGHAIYCRRDVAGVMMALRVEFAGRDHPVGRAVEESIDRLEAECADRIRAGRKSGAIPPGPPARQTAAAYLAALEAIGIQFSGSDPFGVQFAERVTRGVLGLPPNGPCDDPLVPSGTANTSSDRGAAPRKDSPC